MGASSRNKTPGEKYLKREQLDKNHHLLGWEEGKELNTVADTQYYYLAVLSKHSETMLSRCHNNAAMYSWIRVMFLFGWYNYTEEKAQDLTFRYSLSIHISSLSSRISFHHFLVDERYVDIANIASTVMLLFQQLPRACKTTVRIPGNGFEDLRQTSQI